jgi:hypothetical protein
MDSTKITTELFVHSLQLVKMLTIRLVIDFVANWRRVTYLSSRLVDDFFYVDFSCVCIEYGY